MTVAFSPTVQRQRMLRALGLQPLVLRRAQPEPVMDNASPAAGKPPQATSVANPAAGKRLPLIVLLPAGAAGDPRQQALLCAALTSLPIALQRAPCIELSTLREPLPAADAYLVLGSPTMDALDGHVPPAAKEGACVVAADAPSELLAHPARKRALWQALKTLRARHLQTTVV